MKKLVVIISLLSFALDSFGQKRISQAAINDFADNALWKYKYESNGNFRAFINTSLSRESYSISDIAVLMETLKTDSKARELIFKAIYKVTGSEKDGIFNAIYAMGLTAVNAKEVSQYIYEKYILGGTEVVRTLKEQQFFNGTRTFHDSDYYWSYVVTIKENRITLKSYPGKKNDYYKDKTKPQSTYTGVLKAGKITINGSKSEFKMENGNLYEMSVEGTWNEYRPS